MVKNLLVKAIETFEEVAFDEQTIVDDPGQTVAVHWALDVEDPFDTTAGREKNIVAYRILGENLPPSGAHFEIFQPPPTPPQSMHEHEEVETEEGPEMPNRSPRSRRRP